MLNLPGYLLRGIAQLTGTSILYHAVREADGLSVIIKTATSPHPGPRELERLRREYETLQRLREVRGVVKACGWELNQGRPALILEDVGGRALSELVGAPFELERFLSLALSLAEALTEVHRRGVIHKDLKPANILVGPEGQAWLIDFGIATLQRVEHVEAAPTRLVEGTLAYMSPEQTGRMNRAVDYRTDFYSLGVTFYELLTGRLPFQGSDALEWFRAHMAQAPRPPHELVPQLPLAVSAVVMKLLAKVAEERYQGAEGLRVDLERCREGLRRGGLEEFTLGERDVPARFQLPQRLYGREATVATLLESFERLARGGQPELILVRGYSGIGKSSVVQELQRPVLQRRGFFISGKFDQFQQEVPYATLAQAIRELVQHLLAGTDAELATWRQRLREAWAQSGQVLVNVIPQLELIAGRQPLLQELPPAEAQHRFHLVFQKFLGVFPAAGHPLVIFLDDLQWADLASLRLLQHLLTHPDTQPVLLIGAYRDNEVSPSHPLMLLLADMRRAGARVSGVQLEPLSAEQTRQLVADTLPGASQEILTPLSALVHEKTGGNPFFLLQFLQTLHQDGLLERAPQGGWRWDSKGVEAKGYSDNVVEFMLDRLRLLPVGTQHLLRLAACVGNAFLLRTLVIISDQEAEAVEQGLEPALQEGLVAGSAPEHYRFLHDRIQQAAYALIPEQERRAVHLRIGRLLLASLSPQEVRERIFDVTNHLNAGAQLLEDTAERHRLARLNAEAGWRALASGAQRSAITYLSAAFSLLPGDPWEVDPELAFKLRLDLASSEFMTGNAAQARRLVEELLLRARTRADKAAAYRLKSDIHIAASEVEAAVACILECLTLFGMHMSPQPSWAEVVSANEEVWALLGERPIESLIDLPLMTDPDMKAAMSVLSALFTPALFSGGNLLVLHLCRMVSLTLRHGNTDAAAHGYAWYGVVVGPIFKKYREGYAFGRLACDLVERHNFSAYRGKALYSMEIINYWTHPISISLELVRSAFHHALLSGDFQVACYCCNHIVTNRISLGHDLAEVYQESVARLDFARKAGFRDVQDVIRPAQRYVQQLRGLSWSLSKLDGDGFGEERFEAELTPDRLSTMRCWYWVIKMQSRYMCGAYEEARQAGERATELIWSSLSHIQLLDYHLYRGLTLAACCAGAEPREEWLEAVREHQRQLAEWAEHCPENFRAPERLVAAELGRVSGRPDEAMRAYEEALRSARENNFVQNVGLSCELAARFWREQQMPSLAEFHAREAREAYRQWGAHGKVRQLEMLWPDMVPPTTALGSTASLGSSTYDTSSSRLDALTVVKAQQAISEEIVLERLVSTLMQVALESAGAQRGALLLPRGDKLVVMAVSDAMQGGTVLETDEAAQQELPWTLITYVKRTHEPVLIGDASKLHPFSADAYLGRKRARSVLCLPLLRKEQLSGVLYLENSLATEAFSQSRIALLGHIASQAAISMENARLYAEVQRAETALRSANDELERRVEERTLQLKHAQDRLVESARAAGMAEIASNVLHNVGNVLTSVITNTELMRRAVSGSRAGRLKQVATMLEEHSGNLASFLTEDPRGSRLVSYLAALSEEVAGEQERLRGNLAAMEKHISHIRSIVQVQQTYAKTSLLTDECDLAELIEDALHIQLTGSSRHGLSVQRELSPVPRVRVDKHKVLQILVNLISNARHAMEELPEGQRCLVLRLSAEQGVARIQVVDNGAGIAAEVRERLFTHGFTTRQSGHGFGLHSSALAAKVLGGRLTLESPGPGQGAMATLEIPFAELRAPSAS